MFEENKCSKEMNATFDAFINELKNIRTGRVSPDILKSIIIDSYGSMMPLTQLANINNLEVQQGSGQIVFSKLIDLTLRR